MFGWSISASACRSASKRAITCRVSMPGLMTLSATLRRTGCDLLGHVDDAHAPFADLLQQLVGADLRAGTFGDALGRRRVEARRRDIEGATRFVVGRSAARPTAFAARGRLRKRRRGKRLAPEASAWRVP